uniref:Uncharacterized protein n=1 Tax=Acrobeloides nanus TaxID=290746 RepID=A0A914DP22_9BILA
MESPFAVSMTFSPSTDSSYSYGNNYLAWRYNRRLYNDYYPISARPFTFQVYGSPFYGRHLRDVYYYPSRNIARYSPYGF